MLETVYTPLHAACDRYICMSVCLYRNLKLGEAILTILCWYECIYDCYGA